MIGCLDAHYDEHRAQAVCVLIKEWSDALPHQSVQAGIQQTQPYQPGSFYLRELPCLLAVLRKLPNLPQMLVVDGYVWVSPDGKPGLGAHLHRAVDGVAGVIGVAKTSFKGMLESPLVATVQRGHSKNPLFVTSIGVELSTSAGFIQKMHGPHRIPTILRLVDQLARASASQPVG